MEQSSYVILSNKPRKVAIDPYSLDPFYRYKTIQLAIKYIQTKTIITNLDEFVSDIKTDHACLIKYMKTKFGCSVTKKGTDWVISKKLEVDELNDLIISFIVNKILCKVCNLPEIVGKKCNACGASLPRY